MTAFEEWRNRVQPSLHGLSCLACGEDIIKHIYPLSITPKYIEDLYKDHELFFENHYAWRHSKMKTSIIAEESYGVPSKQQELFKIHEHLTTRALALMRNKNADYGAGNDPFANFRRSEAVCNVSAEKGILIRLTDKLSRISTFLDRGEFSVTDESFEDTTIDGINYLILLYALREDRKREIERKKKVSEEAPGGAIGQRPL